MQNLFKSFLAFFMLFLKLTFGFYDYSPKNCYFAGLIRIVTGRFDLIKNHTILFLYFEPHISTMRQFFLRYFLVGLCLLFSTTCSTKHEAISFNILQINDVYEIAPIANGRYGGLARIATIKKQLLAENPNTILVLSGDFLSPSMLGNVEINGEKLKGKQMVAALNAAGLDLAIFGNHEFDIKEEELLERIKESNFSWVATNTFHQAGDSTKPKVQAFKDKNGKDFGTNYIWKITTPDNSASMNLAVLGITIPFNKKPHVHYTDYNLATEQELKKLDGQADLVFALTHLNIAEDKAYAQKFPSIPLLMGGHDHNAMEVREGNTRIVKADANARTAYIHRCTYQLSSKKLSIVSQKVVVGTRIAEDPAAAAQVGIWKKMADSALRTQGFMPDEFLCQIKTPIEAQEAVVRSRQTNAGELIIAAMEANMPATDVFFLGSGSIRLDDVLHESITQYDVLRLLPFGGSFKRISLKGSLLTQILDASEKNNGTGGYLQQKYVAWDAKAQIWTVRGAPIQAQKVYTLVLNDFLLTGQEKGMAFLTPQNKGVLKVYPLQENHKDIRKTLISYLRTQKGI